ncbi:MAG: photosynthetic reaction center cytochrome c subunit family protein [Bryobacteraceae bacterium]
MLLFRLLLATTPIWAQAPPMHGNFERDLGADCAHCHTGTDWTDASKPAFDRARRMSAMVREINSGPVRDLGGVTCYTCHRGKPKPARIPRATWEAIAAKWPAGLAADRRLAMSVYSASLGVDCGHCHESADYAGDSKRPFGVTHTMVDMMSGIPKHFENEGRPIFQCFSCHHGALKPQRVP